MYFHLPSPFLTQPSKPKVFLALELLYSPQVCWVFFMYSFTFSAPPCLILSFSTLAPSSLPPHLSVSVCYVPILITLPRKSISWLVDWKKKKASEWINRRSGGRAGWRAVVDVGWAGVDGGEFHRKIKHRFGAMMKLATRSQTRGLCVGQPWGNVLNSAKRGEET